MIAGGKKASMDLLVDQVIWFSLHVANNEDEFTFYTTEGRGLGLRLQASKAGSMLRYEEAGGEIHGRCEIESVKHR